MQMIIPVPQNELTRQERLKLWIWKSPYSQAEIARHLGVTSTCLCRWLKEERLPVRCVVQMRAFGIPDGAQTHGTQPLYAQIPPAVVGGARGGQVRTVGPDARNVADFLGKPYQTLMSELSCQPGHKAGMDLLLPLMDVTGSTAPLDFLRAGEPVGLPGHTGHFGAAAGHESAPYTRIVFFGSAIKGERCG